MRVLCAIGQQGGPREIQRLQKLIGSGHELYVLHVIDTGPRRELEDFLRRPGMRRPPHPEQARSIDEAEENAARAALEEARQEAERLGFSVEAVIERGRPEQVIVKMAGDKGCQLVALQHNEGLQGRPRIGPESVGHTARFVLDHAGCDVLLLRGE